MLNQVTKRNDKMTEELIAHLETCAWKLEQLGRTFSSTNFTDRHGDGPYCLGLAKNARAAIAKAKGVAATDRARKG